MLTKQEIRQLGNKEMTAELQRTRRELLRSQFDVRNGSSKEAHVLKDLRRYVARLQTIAKEMKIDMKPTMSKAQAAPAEESSKKPSESPASAPKKAAAPKKTPESGAKPAAKKAAPKAEKSKPDQK